MARLKWTDDGSIQVHNEESAWEEVEAEMKAMNEHWENDEWGFWPAHVFGGGVLCSPVRLNESKNLMPIHRRHDLGVRIVLPA